MAKQLHELSPKQLASKLTSGKARRDEILPLLDSAGLAEFEAEVAAREEAAAARWRSMQQQAAADDKLFTWQQQAIEWAAAWLSAHGCEQQGRSARSESRYFRLPDGRQLRVSGHCDQHRREGRIEVGVGAGTFGHFEVADFSARESVEEMLCEATA